MASISGGSVGGSLRQGSYLRSTEHPLPLSTFQLPDSLCARTLALTFEDSMEGSSLSTGTAKIEN